MRDKKEKKNGRYLSTVYKDVERIFGNSNEINNYPHPSINISHLDEEEHLSENTISYNCLFGDLLFYAKILLLYKHSCSTLHRRSNI